MMKWIKAIGSGLVAGLVMFIALAIGTNTGMAPINVPPSAAFLASTTGIQSPPLAFGRTTESVREAQAIGRR